MSGTPPLVSVIVPFYNADRYLADAVDSVTSQTYPHWELLLVDDGSTDGSVAIAQRLAETHAGRVTYLCHPARRNLGASAARNLGIAHARGEYVSFLDADDVWLPCKLEKQVAILQAHPEAAMTYGPMQWWYSWTGHPQDAERDFVQNLRVTGDTLYQPPTLLDHFVRHGSAVPGTCAIMVRRHAVQRLGAFEDRFRDLYDDQVFYAKVALQFSIFVETAWYCRYRQHAESMCAVKTRQDYRRARVDFVQWLDDYVSVTRIPAPEAQALVRAELWRHRHPFLHRQRIRARRLAGAPRKLLRLTTRLLGSIRPRPVVDRASR